jgi:hypothetical protein
MNTPQALSTVSVKTAQTLRIAILFRRQELIREAVNCLAAFEYGKPETDMEDATFAEYWCQKIRDLNDAAIEIGMSY